MVPTKATLARRFALRLFVALVAKNSPAAEANFVAFDRKHLHQYLVAFLQLIAYRADALIGDFADVEQSVRAREDLHKGAEVRDADNLAKVGFPDFRRGGHISDHLQ